MTFFHVQGIPPGAAEAKIAHVAANNLRVLADILHVLADKAIEEAKSCWPKKIFLHFFENFSTFFGIFNGENTLFHL